MCSLWSNFEQPHLTAAKCLHYIGSLSQHMYSDQIFDRVNHTYLLQIMFIIPQKHKFKLLHLSHNTTSTVKSSTSDESSCRRDQHASLYSITALMKSTHIAWHEHLGKKREIEIMHEVKRYDIGIAKETDWTQCLPQSQNLWMFLLWHQREQKGPPNTRHIVSRWRWMLQGFDRTTFQEHRMRPPVDSAKSCLRSGWIPWFMVDITN